MMRVRKYLGVILVAFCALAALSGCDFGNTEHTHAFSKWTVTKAPTCVDQGVQSRECQDCGYVETGKLDAVGHITTKVEAVRATCTTEGLTEGAQCSVCGEVLKAQETIPAFGHAELKDYAVEPTCTTEGLTEGSHCYLCGTVLVAQQAIPATGHKYDRVTIVTPADCMHEGVKKFSCNWCDASYSDIYTTTEHTIITDEAVAPTCTTDGLSQGSHCSVCQLVFAEQSVIPATGHREVADAEKAPTCTQSGLTAGSHCGVCGVVIKAQEKIDALGHQNEEVILQEATCQSAGLKQLTCTVCGHVSQESYQLPYVTETDLYSAAVKYVGELATFDRNGAPLNTAIGFVYSSDGKIITNFTAMQGAYSAHITINGITYPIVSILAYSEQMDIVVLKVDAAGLTPAKLCTEVLTQGETVYAVGAARGMANTFTQGAVVQIAWDLEGVRFVQHDAAITESNTGGLLMNVYGEVVGINTLSVSSAQNMQLSLLVSELNKLTYGEPMTLAQFYGQNTSAYQKIVDMILTNGTKDGLGNMVIYDHTINAEGITIYGLGYEASANRVFVEMSTTSSSGNKIYVRIYITGDNAALEYTCTFSIGSKIYNTIVGHLDAFHYTASSILTYDSYTGMEGSEETMLAMYKPHVNTLLTWLDTYLQKNISVSIAELGFEAFKN